jgi:hypothetical protein
MTPEQAAESLLDCFKRAVRQELELLEVECVEEPAPAYQVYICQLRPHAKQTNDVVRSGDCEVSGRTRKNCMALSPHSGQS